MKNWKSRIVVRAEGVKVKIGAWLKQLDTRFLGLIIIVLFLLGITGRITEDIGWLGGITMYVIIFGLIILMIEVLTVITKQEPKNPPKRWQERNLPFITLLFLTVKEVMICYFLLFIVLIVSIGLINQVFPPIEWTVTKFAWTILAISAFTNFLFYIYTKNKIGEKLSRLVEGSGGAGDKAKQVEIEEGRVLTLLEILAMVATVAILSISVFKPFEMIMVQPENFLEVPENGWMNLTIATYIPTIYYKIKAMNK